MTVGRRYRVDVEDTTGSTVAVIDTFQRLAFTSKISAKGNYEMTISGDDSRVNAIGGDYLFRVWFTDPGKGIDWINIFTGIHKTPSADTFENGRKEWASFGPSLEELLDKAYILYAAGSSEAAKAGISSTVAREFVNENIGALATVANGRDIAGTNPIALGGDPVIGGFWTGSRARKHLLTVLMSLNRFSIENDDQIDFRVSYLGDYAFQFDIGRLGVDRTTVGLSAASSGLNAAGNVPVVFSVLRGNVSRQSKTTSRFNEANVTIGLGQQSGANRVVATAQDNLSLAASSIAQREMIVSATDQTTAAGVLAVAEARLAEVVARENFTFTPRQAAEMVWRDYFVGDFVTVEDDQAGQQVNKQIRAIRATVTPGQTQLDDIRMEFEDLEPPT